MKFDVQLPRTFAEGLAGKTKIDKPMLFVFPKVGIHTMWMKGMLVPLDIVWADETGMIIKVYRNVPITVGPKYSSVSPAKYAIECAAGDAARLGLEEGRRIRIFGHPSNLD